MEGFEKVTISDSMEVENGSSSSKIVDLLRRFLGVQQRRAEAYAKLKRGFADYMISGEESTYQQLCSEITGEFNDCSKQVLEMESLFLNPDYSRDDLAGLLRAVQVQERQKLQLVVLKLLNDHSSSFSYSSAFGCSGSFVTATIQVLKKAGRPSERLVSHEKCRFMKPMEHECVHVHEITEAAGTEEAEANAEYDNAIKEAIRGVQDAVTTINEKLEEVRYEIAALEDA
ncbi:uncharacterized protein LOC132295186 isoform X1 [Cornus florida]|uniref:uncharacterized protein LOC132295186 isoform X1 n=1 Tax=Cornus florida TaxID=4283 RepID=UPI002897F22D|nr:uncharacterized protein LOC132295186 isoform X1 [Cornus florida]